MTQVSSAQRSYNIKNNSVYYHAGYLAKGSQVLMGIQLPELVMVEFTASGELLKTSLQELPPEQQGDEEAVAALNEWQREAGFTPATISVSRFFLTERWIGIKDLPDHYQDFVDHPESYDPQRRVELLSDVQEWNKRGDFVLYWDDEYYLNQDGELESS